MTTRSIIFICACILLGPCLPLGIALLVYGVFGGRKLDA